MLGNIFWLLFTMCALRGQPLKQQHRNGHFIFCWTAWMFSFTILASVSIPFFKFCLACMTHVKSGWKRRNFLLQPFCTVAKVNSTVPHHKYAKVADMAKTSKFDEKSSTSSAWFA